MPLSFFTVDEGENTWFGNVFIGRLLLTEYFDVTDALGQGSGSAGDPGLPRQLTVTGQESMPPLSSVNDVRYRGEQVMAMNLMLVPVVFASKVDRNGYYVVTQPEVDWHHYGSVMSSFEWTIVLERYGTEAEVMVESRLIGGARLSYYTSNLAERWHSPGSGSNGYYAGPSVPSSMTRAGSEGIVTVYRDLAPNVSARWGSDPADYLDGASRITVVGYVMCGMTLQNQPSNWTLENTLLQIEPSSDATFTLNYWNGAAYAESQDWAIYVGSALLTDPSYVSILRNDPEECILRITYITSAGYSTLDLSLRRGSRFVAFTVQHQDSQTFTVSPFSATASTFNSFAGYVTQTSNDGAGNRFTSGSPVHVDVDTSSGEMSNHIPSTSFSGWIGIEYGGTAAISGDNASAIAAQYLGSCAESTRMVAR